MGTIDSSSYLAERRILWVSRDIRTLREGSFEHRLVSRSEGPFCMGTEELEDNNNSSGYDPADHMGRVRQAIRDVTESKVRQSIHRFGIAAGVTWAIVATIFTIQAWRAIIELNQVINGMQTSLNATIENIPLTQRKMIANQQLMIENQQRILTELNIPNLSNP